MHKHFSPAWWAHFFFFLSLPTRKHSFQNSTSVTMFHHPPPPPQQPPQHNVLRNIIMINNNNHNHDDALRHFWSRLETFRVCFDQVFRVLMMPSLLIPIQCGRLLAKQCSSSSRCGLLPTTPCRTKPLPANATTTTGNYEEDSTTNNNNMMDDDRVVVLRNVLLHCHYESKDELLWREFCVPKPPPITRRTSKRE